MITNTYHVSGVLERETLWKTERLSIYRDVEAASPDVAIDSLEVYGWHWIEPPSVWLVTEAMKMELDGQPTLFPLSEAERKE